MSHTTRSAQSQHSESTGYSVLSVASDAQPKERRSASPNYNALRGWPEQPQQPPKRTLGILSELALLSLPVAFLALAATAYSFNKQPVSEHGATLQRIMLLGPTVFPLAFSALGGRSLKNIALWRAERGSTLGNLESLHGSQSVVSAISLTISLRSFSLLSLALLLLWSLSPLGGQSSLRLLYEANQTITTSQPVYYPDLNADSSLFKLWQEQYLNQVSVIISSSISTMDTLPNSPVDIWNHPKIPRLQELERKVSTSEADDPWVDVHDEDHAYTSLTGLSVVGLQTDTSANFSVPYGYIHTDCKHYLRASGDEVKGYFDREFSDNTLPPGWPFEPYNRSEVNGQAWLTNVTYSSPGRGVFYESSFFLVSPINMSWGPATYLFYGTKDTSIDGGLSLYNCTLQNMELEANVLCNSGSCQAMRLRRAVHPLPEDATAGSRLWSVTQDVYKLQSFLEYLPTMGGILTGYSSHPIDNYIYGNMSTSGYRSSYFTPEEYLERNWTAIPDSQVSQRLTEILNTYWEASRWTDTATRTDPFEFFSINQTSGEPFSALQLSPTTATVTRQTPIYKASLPWISILVLCSGTLFALGLFNVFVVLQTSVPDIFGFVSSLTRDNPYVDVPTGGSMLSGPDRTRLIKGLEVRLGDVQEGESVGLIALKSMNKEATGITTNLDRGRLYH